MFSLFKAIAIVVCEQKYLTTQCAFTSRALSFLQALESPQEWKIGRNRKIEMKINALFLEQTFPILLKTGFTLK